MIRRKGNVLNLAGVSLPEVLIALVVLAFITMSVSGMFFSTAKMEKKDQAITEASHVAVTRLEAIKQRVKSADDFNNLISISYFDLPDNYAFVYAVDVEEITTSVKYVGVTVYHRNLKEDDPEPDVSQPALGRVVKMGTYIRKP